MLRCWCISVATLIVLCHIELSHEERDIYKCPIGFHLSYTESKGDPICYRLKEPEYFEDAYEDCIGNLFNLKLYKDLNITKSEHVIWTEYRSYYPGGLLMDTSHTKSFGIGLNLTNISFNYNLDIDEEWCLVIDPVIHETAVKCNEKHYRYCMVKPYKDVDDMSNDGCSDLKSIRFKSPVSTCLAALEGVGGGAIRATWSQARKLCSDRGGSLLYRGWRYANSPILKDKTILPLGVIMSTDTPWLRYDALNDRSEVPRSKWHFAEVNNTNYDESFGAQRNYQWYLVNSSFVFYDVACEHTVPLTNLSMIIISNSENKLILSVNETIDKDDIMCYTDSLGNYPTKISKKRKSNNTFVLNEKKNGYYWCTHKDILNFEPAETNKVLYIKDAMSLKNAYAIKLRLNETYPLPSTLHKFGKGWSLKLREYLYYKSQYERVNGQLDALNAEETLKTYKDTNPGLDVKTLGMELNVKRLYVDCRTILVHATLEPNIGIVSPGTWDGIEVLSMKSAYYCIGFDSVPDTPLGEHFNASGCRTYTCVGDFYEGVQWVTTATVDCTTIHPTTIDRAISVNNTDITQTTDFHFETTEHTTQNSSESSEETTDVLSPTTDVTTGRPTGPSTEADTDCEEVSTTPGVTTVDLTTVSVTAPLHPPRPPTTMPTPTTPVEETTTGIPTTTTLPPEEQLQQVLDDLEGLVNNDSHVFVEDIANVFDQVDGILEQHDNLNIPGQLLHLLDQLGSTVMLNQTGFGSTIRPNIALLMADADPTNPVRGFRIATSDSEQFTETAFQFIAEQPNASVLNSEKSEVVVNLPSSVSESRRRVSFVVFRNDRAFQAESVYAVNSRVLSVNIEDVTHFTGGEVIDIHLNPIVTDLERNESRACAYWHFLENGTGYWSQEGCTFIRATQPGMLDTCRCDHLTHFAEVLVPRAVFSEANESALEIITIVGCFLSLFGLLMIGVTALVFRSWRREYSNKIWLQLCVAIFLLVLSFLFVIFIHFEHYDITCLLIGVTLHYAVLASFCWMLVAAILAYRRLVLVFSRDASHKLLKAAAFSWGAPCVVVGILLSVSPSSYVGRFEEMTPSGSFCYPSGLGLWLAVYAPIAAVLLTNWILFALIVRSVFVSRRIQRHGETNDAIRCASVSCMLVFLFGLPWIFGLFASNIVAAYLFTLTATFQGFILFVFFVLGNKKTRDLWLNKLKIKQTRKVPVTSSTYTNRSAEWRAVNSPMSLDAKASKPKVLSSQDESRFS